MASMEPDKLERMCVDFKKAEKIESDDFQAMAFYSMMEDASHVTLFNLRGFSSFSRGCSIRALEC